MHKSLKVGQKIDQDLQRFRKLVRGKVKSNLSKYISRGEMIGKKGNDYVSIPLPSINLPQFRYGKKNSGGVGVGPGHLETQQLVVGIGPADQDLPPPWQRVGAQSALLGMWR